MTEHTRRLEAMLHKNGETPSDLEHFVRTADGEGAVYWSREYIYIVAEYDVAVRRNPTASAEPIRP